MTSSLCPTQACKAGFLKRGSTKVILGGALLAGVLAFVVHVMDWDDRLYFLYFSKFTPEATLSLNGYQLTEQMEIEGAKNLSGIVYLADRGTLGLIMNNPETLLECDLAGNVLARHPLQGFHDTEGITINGEGRLVVIEERRQSLVTLADPGSDGVIRRDGSPDVIELALFPEQL